MVGFQLRACESGRQAAEANIAPEARSQDGELEQQPKLRDDLLCYITAIIGLPPPTAPIDYLLRRRRRHHGVVGAEA